MKYELSVIKNFSSAHALRQYKGKCENLHGHNWQVKVTFAGTKLDKTGMLIDFTDIKAFLDKIIAGLDHKFLNETPPFDKTNPTAENIASYIFKELETYQTETATVSAVEVWESLSSSAKVTA
jgi:6-pyruvoyltetrahydropterin/6-carboxytetrahydropterin synthase